LFLTPIPGLIFLVDIHLLIGVLLLVFAFYNRRILRASQAPARIKRISAATASLAVFQSILGVALFLNFRMDVGLPFAGVVETLHAITALAIITQAASTATAYDM
jgi:uncharacterized membrane-anchored protein